MLPINFHKFSLCPLFSSSHSPFLSEDKITYLADYARLLTITFPVQWALAALYFAVICLFFFWDFAAAPVQFSLHTGDLVEQLGWSREMCSQFLQRSSSQTAPSLCAELRGCFVSELKGIYQNENAPCGGWEQRIWFRLSLLLAGMKVNLTAHSHTVQAAWIFP